MTVTDLLLDLFSRVADELPSLVADLNLDQLLWAPAPQVNHIAWLCWHIGRCEDEQIATITAGPSVYVEKGWAQRFALPYAPTDIGYQHSAEQVRAFVLTDPMLLTDYYAAVHERTRSYLHSLTDADLDALIPHDPYRATVGTRLISIANDITQHLGQVAYLRGLISADQG